MLSGGYWVIQGFDVARLSNTWGERDAPTVVFLHGIGASSHNWWRVGPALAAQGFSVMAVDLAGHGGVPAPRPLTYNRLYDDAVELISTISDSTSDRIAALVGHSLGALLSLDIALKYPSLVRSLVMEEPAMTQNIVLRHAANILYRNALDARSDPETFALTELEKNPDWHLEDARSRSFGLMHCDPHACRELVMSIPNRLSTSFALLTQPTLLLLAQPDLGSSVPFDVREQVSRNAHHLTIEELPTSHSLHRGQHQRYVEIISGWLRDEMGDMQC